MTKRKCNTNETPPFKRHPAAIAEDAWYNSEEAKTSRDPSFLRFPEKDRQYLENRLTLAFQAGWKAAENHFQDAFTKAKNTLV